MEGSSKSFRSSFGVFVFLIGLILIGFNYWQLMTCVKTESFDIDEHLSRLQQRILEAESQVSADILDDIISSLHFHSLSYSLSISFSLIDTPR
jgi:hypothetical protein